MIEHLEDTMTKLTIDSVQHDFKEWRTSRLKKGRIPMHLWDKALKLLEQYPVSKVAEALSVNGGQLAAKRKQHKANTTAEPLCPVNFVELNIASATPYDTSICSRLEIKRTDGVVLAIEHLSKQIILQLLSQFTRETQ